MADEELSLDQLQAKGAKFGGASAGDGEELDLEQLQAKGAKFAKPTRPEGFVDRIKFAFQHPIESLKDEIPKALGGAEAASENALNGATFGAYRQLRDARSVPEALLNTAPASERTLKTEEFNRQHPIVANASELAGAMTGGPKMLADSALAVAGPVLRSTDNIIGRKALDIATSPAKPAGPVMKAVNKVGERLVHGVIGHAIGGIPGAIGSQIVSPLVHDAMAAGGNKIVGKLADRYLARAVPGLAEDSGLLLSEGDQAAQQAKGLLRKADVGSGRKVVENADIPGLFGIDVEGASKAAARKPLAPLVPKSGEIWDPEAAAWEFGERPRGQKTMYPGAEEAAGARASEPKMTETSEAGTAAIPKPSFSEDVISHTKNGKTLADAVKAAEEGPSLHETVSRDAKANVKGPGGGAFEHPDTPTDLAESLKASIEMAQKLRAAKAAGTLTPEMVKAARDAGMSPAFIKQLGGVAN